MNIEEKNHQIALISSLMTDYASQVSQGDREFLKGKQSKHLERAVEIKQYILEKIEALLQEQRMELLAELAEGKRLEMNWGDGVVGSVGTLESYSLSEKE